MVFDSDAEAIAAANDTEFGPASHFYARDISRVWKISEGLEYGRVCITPALFRQQRHLSAILNHPVLAAMAQNMTLRTFWRSNISASALRRFKSFRMKQFAGGLRPKTSYEQDEDWFAGSQVPRLCSRATRLNAGSKSILSGFKLQGICKLPIIARIYKTVILLN